MKALLAWLALCLPALAANPYLALPDDQPVTRQFSGREWGDEVELPAGKESAPFQAKVTTQRVASMSWGAIYKISFESASKRSIEPYWFLATDREILLLDGADMDRDIRIIQAMKKQPKFQPRDVWALSKGKLKLTEGPWTTEISLRGDTCMRQALHDGSGHFGRVVWKKSEGLVEIAQGRGSMADGFELKSTTPKRAK